MQNQQMIEESSCERATPLLWSCGKVRDTEKSPAEVFERFKVDLSSDMFYHNNNYVNRACFTLHTGVPFVQITLINAREQAETAVM